LNYLARLPLQQTQHVDALVESLAGPDRLIKTVKAFLSPE
jgi:hypothetical protein